MVALITPSELARLRSLRRAAVIRRPRNPMVASRGLGGNGGRQTPQGDRKAFDDRGHLPPSFSGRRLDSQASRRPIKPRYRSGDGGAPTIMDETLAAARKETRPERARPRPS